MAAAFFVATLIHVKVGPTSVHLLLNGLVGVILGRRAPLAIAVGLFLQAALLGHGGFLPLGVNTCVMSLPALLASLISFGVSAALFLSGLIADGVNTNRRLLEDALYRLKRLEADIVTEDREPWAMQTRPLR